MPNRPELIRFRGAFYRKAVEGEDREWIDQEVKKIQRQLKDELPTEKPSQESTQKTTTVVTPEKVEQAADSALDLLVAASANAENLMQKAGIKYQGDFMYAMGVPAEKEDADEDAGWNVIVGGDEGVEVNFNVKEGNFSADFQDEPLAIFDYRIFDKDGRGFWKGLWNSIKTVSGFGGQYELHEFIFHFCTHNFGASADDKKFTGELLEAVGFIQNPSKVVKLQGAARVQKIEDNIDEVELRNNVVKLLADIMEEEQENAAKSGAPITRWQDPEQAKRTVDRLRQTRFLTKKQQNAIVQIIDSAGNTYESLIQEAIELARGATPSAKGVTLSDRVERYIKQLTAHEDYSGKVSIYVDVRTNNIIAEIDAPYKFRYYLKKQPGGKLELDHASMKMCDFEFIVNTEDNAKQLLTHDVTFGMAYGAAVNPKRTKKYAKNDLQALYEKLKGQAVEELHGKDAGGEVEKPMG
jgi:hypothetical protein